jgi:hypothetical protein
MRQRFTTPAFDDLRSPASGINPAGSPSAATPSLVDGSLTFTKGNVATVWFQIPHSWEEGSAIYPHIHWSKTTSAVGIVNWQIKYKVINIGEVAPAFSAYIAGTEAVPNSDTANKHALLSFPTISMIGKTLSAMVCIYLERINDGIDTYSPAVNLYEVDLHYKVDGFGSRQEVIK